MMNKGTFVISLDTEIAWGRIEEKNQELFYPLYDKTKNCITRLIELFDQYKTPVTWALVGRMIDDYGLNEQNEKGQLSIFYKNLHIHTLKNSKLNNSQNSYIAFPECLTILTNSKMIHEIGSHSYDHIVFGDIPNEKKGIAKLDIARAREILLKKGINPLSFVFPRNSIKHKAILKQNGFTHYRGNDEFWYDNLFFFSKILKQLNYFLPIPPKIKNAKWDEFGLIEVPGGLLFRIPHQGFKNLIPFSILKRKAINGLNRASKSGGIFHLWFHPFNFAYKSEEHFRILEEVLIHANKLVDKNVLNIKTMKEIRP